MDKNSQQKLIKFLVKEPQEDAFILPAELLKIE